MILFDGQTVQSLINCFVSSGEDEDLQKRCQIQQETIERLENQIQELSEKLTLINVSKSNVFFVKVLSVEFFFCTGRCNRKTNTIYCGSSYNKK